MPKSIDEQKHNRSRDEHYGYPSVSHHPFKAARSLRAADGYAGGKGCKHHEKYDREERQLTGVVPQANPNPDQVDDRGGDKVREHVDPDIAGKPLHVW
ncbi:hypothetical protein GCM10010464_53610 [Pseudonocardia yunnanensis]|uniref:Uncharacterized protein n=1 Tax=Pseudonocardia yunnanensis TaxID=58107 RepID=A0ABW4F6Y9_9PSEU